MKTIVEFPEKSMLAEESAAWLIRLDADTPPTKQDLRDLGEWLHRSPAHRDELERLAVLWGRMNVLTELAVPLGRPGGAPGSHESQARRFFRKPILLAASLAASVAVAVAIGWLAHPPTPDPWLATNDLYATAVGQQKTATLADGSQVILNTNSQIRVKYGDASREVHLLQGEALFTVAKNDRQPFRVYAGNGRIEAVGTAFSVYLNGRDVDVTVAEGRVSLASIKPSRALVPQRPVEASKPGPTTNADSRAEVEFVESLGTLTAGQAATIRSTPVDVAAGGVALEISEPLSPDELAQRLAWREGVLMFSGDTLEDVVREVSRYTTVSIEIPDPAVRRMRIGGRFPVGETEAMLAALEANFDLRATHLTRNRVILSAAGE